MDELDNWARNKAIRELKACGWSAIKLAKLNNISRQRVYQISEAVETKSEGGREWA